MTATEKIFTVDEARRALPYIKRIVLDILNSAGQDEMAFEERYNETTGSLVLVPNHTLKVVSLINELEEIGCHYKDFANGTAIVDFPAELNGRKILICWKSDEEDITTYHEISQGFSGRKRLPYYD